MSWSNATRASFGELIDRGVLDVTDGYRAKNSELGGTGLIFLRAGHVTDSHIDFVEAERFLDELTPRLKEKVSEADDVAVTTKGNSTGRTAYVTPSMPPFVYSPHLSRWRSLNRDQLEPGFLRYWSSGREFGVQLRGMSASTDMAPYLSLRDQRRLKITLPHIEEQRAIAGVLGALDDKIEQNRLTAGTLERLARAIFQAWFVDFEPVKAKAAGATAFPSMSQPVFDALPTRFVDSDIGPVPQGWEAVSIYDMAEVIYGTPFSSKLFNDRGEGLPLIRIRDLQTHEPTTYTTEQHPKGALVRPADIVVGMDGEFRLHYWLGTDAWLNQRLCRFEPLPEVPRMFLGESLRTPLQYFERAKTGTTVIHLGKADIDTFRVLRPASPVLGAFRDLTDSVLEMTVCAAQESRNLAATRDYLLPKLLSGEVRVCDAQRLIAASA